MSVKAHKRREQHIAPAPFSVLLDLGIGSYAIHIYLDLHKTSIP
jgi:hypothetical protein